VTRREEEDQSINQSRHAGLALMFALFELLTFLSFLLSLLAYYYECTYLFLGNFGNLFSFIYYLCA
jgi:hypothetical protein